MFGRTKDDTKADQAVLDEACCVVNDAVEAIVDECCVEIEKNADQAILDKGHPTMRGRYPSHVWREMTSDEQDKAWEVYETDLETYHAAYLRVHGVECRDCTC